MRQVKYWAFFLALGILQACSQIGLAPAQTFDQKLAYGYSALASVRTSTANALTAGQIKVADAKQVQDLADQSRTLLDAADVAQKGGDTTTAAGKLQLATTILTQLQAYLTAHGVK